jgi:phosphate uptake regulator
MQADDRIDRDQDRVVQDAIREIEEHPEISPQEVDLILIAENLERIGDHVTHIAEDVTLDIEAGNVKHAGELAGGLPPRPLGGRGGLGQAGPRALHQPR